MVDKSPDAFRTISEVATDLDVPQHVLRFWESKFSQIKPLKRGGGRRYYRPEDVDLLRGIRTLLYSEGYTIKGVQKVFRDHGVRFVIETGRQQERSAEAGVPPTALAAAATRIVAAEAPAAESLAVGGKEAGSGTDKTALLKILGDLKELRQMLAAGEATD